MVRDCNLDLTRILGGRKKRQVAPEPLLPEAIMARAQTLSGVFKYGKVLQLVAHIQRMLILVFPKLVVI